MFAKGVSLNPVLGGRERKRLAVQGKAVFISLKASPLAVALAVRESLP